MRIYVAGPMSGLKDFNYPAFNHAALVLRGLGFHVENPADNTAPDCGTWEGWMRKAIAQVITCERMVMLDGWINSKGARIEYELGAALGMKPVTLSEFLDQNCHGAMVSE